MRQCLSVGWAGGGTSFCLGYARNKHRGLVLHGPLDYTFIVITSREYVYVQLKMRTIYSEGFR